MMNRFARALARRPFVRSAIADSADLGAFRERPTIRVIGGVFAIAFSYVIGWPLISVLGAASIYYKAPLVVVIGGPLAYGCSHLVFLLGMYLAGGRYTLIFLRWATRIGVLALLEKFPPAPAPADPVLRPEQAFDVAPVAPGDQADGAQDSGHGACLPLGMGRGAGAQDRYHGK